MDRQTVGTTSDALSLPLTPVGVAPVVARGPTSPRAEPVTPARRLGRRYGFLGWLALPFVFYLVPLFEGYAWSSVNGQSLNFNVLNPPEHYQGRQPEFRTTAEAWGASVVVVPFQARLRHYLLAGELPLWNPYQGLGQPFAAQGDGSPYFPAAIVRALVPSNLGNYVTVVMGYLSAVCLYLFLRGLGASGPAALFAGMLWPLTGAVSLHLARPNVADQVCMIPPLFWAMAAAVRTRSVGRYVVLALVSGLHLVAGFIQVAMLSALVAGLFGAWYARLLQPRLRAWAGDVSAAFGAAVLGNGLGAFSLFPMLEAMWTSFSKNVAGIAFLVPITEANIVGFLTPYLFGQPFYHYWISSPPRPTVDWDNLFAFSGLLPAALVAAALPGLSRLGSPRRGLFLFFVAAFVVVTLRYLSVPPVSALNLLPILGHQSPKHATGVMVFCLVVAAGLALDGLPQARRRHGFATLAVLLALLGGLVMVVVGRLGGLERVEPGDVLAPALSMTVTVIALVVVAVAYCLGRDVVPRRAAIVLGGVGIAELSLYVPLGNADPTFLLSRLALTVLVAGAAFALGSDRPRVAVPAAAIMAVAAVVGYAALVAWPRTGLPRQFEIDQPPTFMRWLASVETADDRSFGIVPEWSSIAQLQDIGVVGPLAPPEFLEFVRLVADERTAREYGATTHFMLAGPWQYDLTAYHRARPILDWVGVRYVVLDHLHFREGRRTDAAPLLQAPISLRQAYQDRRVTILESPTAQSRAEFWSSFTVDADQQAVLATLQRDPSAVLGAPRVEASQAPAEIPASSPEPVRTTVPVASYRPNSVELAVDAPTGGLLVLKDVYAPGWSATLNGATVPIVRVNGLVRGVVVPDAGQYTVRFSYRPATFTWGVYTSLASAVTLLALLALSTVRSRTLGRRSASPAPRLGSAVP